MKHLFLFSLLATATLFCGCEKEEEDESSNKSEDLTADPVASVKQIDMTVMTPIEPSSLEYFDYVVRYSDNNGLEQMDTVRKEICGIVVEDWENGGLYEITLAQTNKAFDNHNCFVKTFSYTSLPVSSNVTVELLPKCSKESVVSFSFITPKPYIYSNVYSSESSIPKESINRTLDGVNIIQIDSMSIERFLSVYGNTFTSCCQVKNENGIDITFY